MLVRPVDRQRAASALADIGFQPMPEARSISRELVLSRNGVDIDLHWGLLREGRLRADETVTMLGRVARGSGVSVLSPEDAAFLLLVHPAFAKHLASFGMGLHRVADVWLWLSSQEFDASALLDGLERNGVRSAAWATLRWVAMLFPRDRPKSLIELTDALRPGKIRHRWLEYWLEQDLSERLARQHWFRLAAFSPFLHDSAGDTLRAIGGRIRAKRRVAADLAAFEEFLGPQC